MWVGRRPIQGNCPFPFQVFKKKIIKKKKEIRQN
jgi:hypothetical protein